MIARFRLQLTPAFWLAIGLLLLILSLVLSLSIGSSSIAFDQFIEILLQKDRDSHQAAIIWQVRLPRILMAAISGAGLALVGATIQALVRNPMADPWLLGVSSGAALGAVTVIVFGIHILGSYSLQIMAFIGALAAASCVYQLAKDRGRQISSARLILLGIAVSFALGAITQLLVFSAKHSSQVRSILFWTMGSLGGIELADLSIPAITLLGSFIYLFRVRHQLGLITLSDAKAFSLGINLKSFRRNLFLVTALLTSVLVAVTGSIGFVGLMVPHLLRSVVGAHYKILIPACFLYGASFLIIADAFARYVFAPEELPVGVFTALLGSPLFIWLMRRSRAI